MSWDTEATRQKLLTAAVGEFADRGFAGARIREISNKSGCNPERIYFYFGNKEGLFEAALVHELSTALDAVTVVGQGIESIVAFAEKYFDFSSKNSKMARLAHWEGLEHGSAAGAKERSVRAESKVQEIRNALGISNLEDAQNLLFVVVSLCNSLLATPNVHQVILGKKSVAGHKKIVADTIRSLAQDLVENESEGQMGMADNAQNQELSND
ncbi:MULTISPECIES: TetR/AcrR family transcriptional regulator [Micrococcaceae]|uniref:TetR/AcrR family transcriptional regulator n=1 Tax=Micrococcaceae TaxID=1268 RepID=UPI0013EF7A58|nr:MULTISPECIES: TetR/AcrR family transcriptional regulator [Micrococcaceae]UXN32758.1 TetR/AcrR family transcriptional regulator [Glutamicibacter sp. M10]